MCCNYQMLTLEGSTTTCCNQGLQFSTVQRIALIHGISLPTEQLTINHKHSNFKIEYISTKRRAYSVYGKLFYKLMLLGPCPTPHQLSNMWGYLFTCLALMILPGAYTPVEHSKELRHPKFLRWMYWPRLELLPVCSKATLGPNSSLPVRTCQRKFHKQSIKKSRRLKML